MSNPQNEGIILFHRFISIEAFAASPGCNELTNLDTYESNIHDNLYLFFSYRLTNNSNKVLDDQPGFETLHLKFLEPSPS